MKRIVLLLLIPLLPLSPMFAPGAEAAGPKTTARLLAQANELASRPLAERVDAYRAVLRARKRFDVNSFRALRKLATLFGKRNDPHAQAALAACSSVRHPKNQRGTYLARVRLARGLRAEGDLAAAHVILRDVVERGGRVAIWSVAKSLSYLGEDAYDTGDRDTVRWAVQTGKDARIEPVAQMKLVGYLGLIALQDGNRRKAVQLQLRCWKLYDQTQTGEPKVARQAAKAWLDLPLRKALAKDKE